MKEASRIQAIIEVMDEIIKDLNPADNILDEYFKKRRYIGSKDRRFIADEAWKIIRNRMKYTEMLSPYFDARLLVGLHFINSDLELLFNSEEYAPMKLSKLEKETLKKAEEVEDLNEFSLYECPKWLFDKFDNKRLLESLNEPAYLDVRANLTSREKAKERLKKEGLFFSYTPLCPIGLRSYDRINLNNCITYQDGDIEVMDEASQIIALLCNVKKHHKVIDYCAGAGGKSLAIGALLNNEGVIFAHDINAKRLAKINKRAERLGIKNIKLVENVKDDDFQRFIIDAPCSGSGTWRRSPDAKFRLTLKKLEETTKTQEEILEFGANHVKDGGELIYITCSVFPEENEEQIEKFLKKHPNFEVLNHKELWKDILDINVYPFDSERYLKFSPLNTKTDGFFFCALKKNPS
ncbi:MAG: RsmB/NOP family class I SAM-dependent RNA methyltransferase [Alphaproteobacteria bacterium]|nr:RsmB/NOP family class I SAM-dependent RNA methyltransferase [Alphaproteobacteria bacterium]